MAATPLTAAHLPNFDACATDYDALTPIQSQAAVQLARQIAVHASTNQTVLPKQTLPNCWLDVGCGTGKLSAAVLAQCGKQPMASNLAKLYGVDNASAMLAQWQARCKAWLQANQLPTAVCQPSCADMAALPFADGVMTLTFSSFALHWADPQVLAELVRVTATGGQVHIAVPVAGSLSALQTRFAELPIFAFLPVTKWQTALDQQVQLRGGRLLYAKTLRFCQPFDNLAALLKNLKGMGGAVQTGQHVPVATLRRYLADTRPVKLDYNVWLAGAAV